MDTRTPGTPGTLPASDPGEPPGSVPGASRAAELRPGQIVGKCRIVHELGRGGMGAVYRGEHLTLGIPVAVKVLPHHLAASHPDLGPRFLREARLCARLRHPNVIQVMDADLDPASGLHYIVMELVEGTSVRDILAAGPLPPSRAVSIAAAVAGALTEAGRLGIVHRDIKPDNVLVAHDGSVKLGDLGLALDSIEGSDRLTMSAITMGTPRYMSPEQIRSAKHVDARTDLYALGATLYHMLVGEPPFDGETAFEISTRVVHDPVPDPCDRVPGLDPALGRLVVQLMAKEPEQRPGSATEVVRLLRSVDGTAAGGREAPGTIPSMPSPLPAPRERDHAAARLQPAAGSIAGAAAPSAPAGHRPAMDATVALAASPGAGLGPGPRIAAGRIAAALALVLAGSLATLWLRPGTPTGDVRDPSPGHPVRGPMDSMDPVVTDDPEAPPAHRHGPRQQAPPEEGPHGFRLLPALDRIVLSLDFEDEPGPAGWLPRDRSTFHHELELIGGMPGPGHPGRGLTLQGHESSLTAPPLPLRTIALWFHHESGGEAGLFQTGGRERLEGWTAAITNPQGRTITAMRDPAIFISFVGLHVAVTHPDLHRGWHHLAVSWDGAHQVRVMLDGEFPEGYVIRGRRPEPAPRQPFILPEAPHPPSGPVILGRALVPWHPGEIDFHGHLDDVLIWDVPLGEAELARILGPDHLGPGHPGPGFDGPVPPGPGGWHPPGTHPPRPGDRQSFDRPFPFPGPGMPGRPGGPEGRPGPRYPMRPRFPRPGLAAEHVPDHDPDHDPGHDPGHAPPGP